MNNPSQTVPQSIEAEVGVLGAMLIEESIVGDIIPLLDKSYFLSTAHQSIFDAIAGLFDSNHPVDPVAIQEELKRRGTLEQVGGQSYLLSLMEAVFSAGNAEYYARVVREKGVMRQLIKAADQIAEATKSEKWSSTPF